MATALEGSAREARAKQYFATSARYLSRNHRIAIRAEIVAELVGDLRGKRILDLGCGNGEVSAQFLPANHVVMLDQSAQMIAQAQVVAKGAEHVCGDILGYTGAPFDLILCIGVLAHVDSTVAVIASIARNLSPGGRCVLQLSDSRKPLNRLAALLRRIARRALRYRDTPLDETVFIAERYGLRVIDRCDHLLLLPGMGRVLGQALVGWDRIVRRVPWLARHGLDTVLLLERA
jgi:ubiquinone/menaquinone biosynthesis C-methylase UbiE